MNVKNVASPRPAVAAQPSIVSAPVAQQTAAPSETFVAAKSPAALKLQAPQAHVHIPSGFALGGVGVALPEMPAPWALAATALRLGPPKGSFDLPSGGTRHLYAGGFIDMRAGQIHGVTLNDASGKQVHLSPAVVDAAVHNDLGKLLSTTGSSLKGGTYTFENGTVTTENTGKHQNNPHDEKVVSVVTNGASEL